VPVVARARVRDTPGAAVRRCTPRRRDGRECGALASSSTAAYCAASAMAQGRDDRLLPERTTQWSTSGQPPRLYTLALSDEQPTVSSRFWRSVARLGVSGRHGKEGVDGSSPSEGFRERVCSPTLSRLASLRRTRRRRDLVSCSISCACSAASVEPALGCWRPRRCASARQSSVPSSETTSASRSSSI